MAAEVARSGKVRTERKLFLTLTGLLMEGDYTNYLLSLESRWGGELPRCPPASASAQGNPSTDLRSRM